ncbi:hypothetical protein Tco_1581552 [Tanacetum coccineum]
MDLEERLDKHGSRLYKLENLNIPYQVSKAVDEIVTHAIDWAMQAPLRARFRDLPTVDMKEILQQQMFEDNTYKTHEVYNDLYEALQKSVELDYSNQCLADQEEASKKKRRRSELPRTPPGYPPTQPPPPPPLAGVSGALGTFRASRFSQFPPPPPPPSTGTSRSAQQQGSKAPSSSKTTASASQSMAWTTSDTQYESADIPGLKNSENDHQPKADSRKDWWKPLPEEERPTTHEPAWIIPYSSKSDVVNNWASALATTYEPPTKNSLLAKIGDMTTFMNWYYQKMEECHKMLTAQVDWMNPEGDHFRINVNRPLPLEGPLGHVTI